MKTWWDLCVLQAYDTDCVPPEEFGECLQQGPGSSVVFQNVCVMIDVELHNCDGQVFRGLGALPEYSVDVLVWRSAWCVGRVQRV